MKTNYRTNEYFCLINSIEFHLSNFVKKTPIAKIGESRRQLLIDEQLTILIK